MQLWQFPTFLEALTFFKKRTSWEALQERILGISSSAIKQILGKNEYLLEDLPHLLSPAADEHLELLAQKAKRITTQRFGKTIQLYVPLYVSNYCTNSCVYCGFNVHTKIARSRLTVSEAVTESELLRQMGFRHVLIVSGEAPEEVNTGYFVELTQKLRHMFSSIGIEIQPLSIVDYQRLIESGVDNVTCYQETYRLETYHKMHPAGPKQDFDQRLTTLDRAATAGIRKVGLSPLYGLEDWRVEGFMAGFHATYLAHRYWQTDVSLSFPRITPSAGQFKPPYPLTDRNLVQLITAFRLVFPYNHLVLSTREPATLRDRLLGLGITQMSAASKTSPFGYTHQHHSGEQFQVNDNRSLEEVIYTLKNKGFDPIYKDWDEHFLQTDQTLE